MRWFLLWVVMVAAAAVLFFLIGRSLWRKGMALIEELGEAADRLGAISEQLETLADRTTAEPELAVFSDPTALRLARDRERRARHSGRHSTSGRPR